MGISGDRSSLVGGELYALRLAAIGADAIEHGVVAIDTEPRALFGDVCGHESDRNIYIHDNAALVTVDVVMAIDPFVEAAGLIGEGELLNEPVLGKQVQCSIDGAVGDGGILPTHAFKDLACSEMPIVGLDLGEDNGTLRGISISTCLFRDHEGRPSSASRTRYSGAVLPCNLLKMRMSLVSSKRSISVRSDIHHTVGVSIRLMAPVYPIYFIGYRGMGITSRMSLTHSAIRAWERRTSRIIDLYFSLTIETCRTRDDDFAMNTPPPPGELSLPALTQLVARQWDIHDAQLSYVPLGFGSHHWLARDADTRTVFVTADRVDGRPEDVTRLRRAMSTAWHLAHTAGIDAVVAPIPTVDDDLVVTLESKWVVTVFPHLPVEPSNWGRFGNDADRDRAQQLVARIHAATHLAAIAEIPSREDFQIACRDDLFVRLDDLSTAWTSGPYGEATRTLLLANVDLIRAGFAQYDALAEQAHSGRDGWVVTHGEPHAGNIVRRADTRQLVMVDWDTCALAPRERDLWQLFPEGDQSLEQLGSYLRAAKLPAEAISPNLLHLYRLRWDLEEIAIYADWYYRAHEDTEDMRTGWDGLAHSVSLLPGHLERGKDCPPGQTPVTPSGEAQRERARGNEAGGEDAPPVDSFGEDGGCD